MLINWFWIWCSAAFKIGFRCVCNAHSKIQINEKKSNGLKDDEEKTNEREGKAHKRTEKHNQIEANKKRNHYLCEDMHKIPATELFMHAIRYCYANLYCRFFSFTSFSASSPTFLLFSSCMLVRRVSNRNREEKKDLAAIFFNCVLCLCSHSLKIYSTLFFFYFKNMNIIACTWNKWNANRKTKWITSVRVMPISADVHKPLWQSKMFKSKSTHKTFSVTEICTKFVNFFFSSDFCSGVVISALSFRLIRFREIVINNNYQSVLLSNFCVCHICFIENTTLSNYCGLINHQIDIISAWINVLITM